MVLLRSIVAVTVWALATPSVHASCRATPSKRVKLVVASCTAVDTSKVKADGYAGILVDGAIDGASTRVWIPASEGVACAAVKPKAVVMGKLDFACCDGDPNPPCLLHVGAILTSVKV